MKLLYFKPLMAFAIMLVAGAALYGQSVKKDFHEEYNTTASTQLVIENQFGTLTVEEWDQAKVVIDVLVQVTAGDQARAEKLMDRIKIEFAESGSKISAITRIDGKESITLGDGKKDKKSFTIDYTVKCPKNIKASFSNQFGDVSIGTLTGPVELDVQFGSLNVVGLTGEESSIEIQFGNATIGKLTKSSVEAQYSGALKISEAGSLSLEAQFSEIVIGTVGTMDGEFNSSSLVVENLLESMRVEGNMGSINVKSVAPDFKSIEIEQNMGEVELRIDPKAGYRLNAEATMGTISVPDEFKADKSKAEEGMEIPGVSTKKVTGVFGSGASKVNLSVNMGSIKVK